MEIPNLTENPPIVPVKSKKFSFLAIILVAIVAITSGFWLSRFFPLNKSVSNLVGSSSSVKSAEEISGAESLKVGQIYGQAEKNFSDSAIGTIQKGSLNGEGTHTLIRDGGDSQKVALTSSTLDLDLFEGKKVEIKGETNTSRKVGWFMDVGSVKILE